MDENISRYRPEYRLSYFKGPDKEDPFEHWTFQWSRTFTLPEARKKAMWLISHHTVIPNKKTYFDKYPMEAWVEISKSGKTIDGILIKYGGEYYYSGNMDNWHKVNSNGTIQTNKVKLPGMPRVKAVKPRRK